ncbi:hypothetical protein [Teredinibacter turnerae]|uniref:hypothetical protein n=1 Tax=Teredinibacter turnerae TaxID=2426 RepID=UPI001E47F1CB|nr:hypothetical protein [Teredinibacter turnerae]
MEGACPSGTFGVHALPAYVAAVLLVLGCYAVLQIRRVSVLPAGENAHFEPMVQTSAEVLEMISKEESEPEHEDARAEEAKQ